MCLQPIKPCLSKTVAGAKTGFPLLFRQRYDSRNKHGGSTEGDDVNLNLLRDKNADAILPPAQALWPSMGREPGHGWGEITVAKSPQSAAPG